MLDLDKKRLLAEKIVDMGKEELDRIKAEMDTEGYKVEFNIKAFMSNTTCVNIEDKMLYESYKKRFGIFNRKKAKINFNIKYILSHKKEAKDMLKEVLYIPNEINIDDIEREYGIEEDDCFLILSLLHELAHAKDMLLDLYENEYLKRTNVGMAEAQMLILNATLYHISNEEVNIRYRNLPREKYADIQSIQFFKENFEKIVNFYKSLA